MSRKIFFLFRQDLKEVSFPVKLIKSKIFQKKIGNKLFFSKKLVINKIFQKKNGK